VPPQLAATAACAAELIARGATAVLAALCAAADAPTAAHAARVLARLAAASVVSAAAADDEGEEAPLTERFAAEGGVDALAHARFNYRVSTK
jgi:hypothetical protein